MFEGWVDHPPTNLLLRAIVEGLGGKTRPAPGPNAESDPKANPAFGAAQQAMQQSVLQEIQAKAGNRIPVVQGKDRGLPQAPPVFDLEALRQRNETLASKFKRAG